ncbi:unnamed protein product [Lepeophtheirus salmonis]|uniref:(salmon louse) hypothetical protein n=1 Tax=Lepeophtheirus salmonis TaxID=72036 RepID=A0A7R8H9E5_LEPSM|nr:unnamed protein product [Lepeophtheirus salmonis]CAF2955165.1 unnamed protein product [Lepeophtheirus salmonis]
MKFDILEQEDNDITLSPELAKAAKEELGETPAIRRQCLKEFREWIRREPRYSKGIRLDANFLLRFLRFAKFEMSDTHVIFEKYIHARTNHPEWFTKLNSAEDDKIYNLISRGYLFALPGKDEVGRTVIYSKACAMDASQFTSSDVIRVHILFYESLLEEPENQIYGLSYILDERDTNWSHISVWTPSEITKAFACTEGALPIRHRSVHLVYLPWTLMLVFHFAKNLLSHKLRRRLHLHPSFEELTKNERFFKKSLLPVECGLTSELSMEKMISSFFLEKLDEVREPVLRLDEINSALV